MNNVFLLGKVCKRGNENRQMKARKLVRRLLVSLNDKVACSKMTEEQIVAMANDTILNLCDILKWQHCFDAKRTSRRS